mmetsp:Transcript_19500/g.18626  ORF Transcript_19500/g.18626 Transcript_19500/m.18626 type:complete len:80 (-) Transcript_19500:320-559(-)
MLRKDNEFFDQLKPDLRYRLIAEVFGDIYKNKDNIKCFKDSFIFDFRYLFTDKDMGFLASKEMICEFVSNLYCRIFIPN